MQLIIYYEEFLFIFLNDRIYYEVNYFILYLYMLLYPHVLYVIFIEFDYQLTLFDFIYLIFFCYYYFNEFKIF